MNEQNQMELFRSGKITTAVFKNAIPAMIAMLMVLIYNIADTFFMSCLCCWPSRCFFPYIEK